MSNSMYGKDHEYAHSRLVETIVRRGGKPVFIYSVNPGMIVHYCELSDIEQGQPQSAHIDEFDLHPVPLGYCNYNKSAGYLSRVPMRRDWRQGLRRGNFVAQGGGVQGERIPYEVLAQVIVGDYPTFTAALDVVRKIKSVAWHRHWCVNSALEVFYKGGMRPVGNVENCEVVLASKYHYLTEALKDSL